MSSITVSSMKKITGAHTSENDLFLITIPSQGENGSRAITRRELSRAIQSETFSSLKANGGILTNVDFNYDNSISETNESDTILVTNSNDNKTYKISIGEFNESYSLAIKSDNIHYIDSNANQLKANGSRDYPWISFSQALDNLSEENSIIYVFPGSYFIDGNIEVPYHDTKIISIGGSSATHLVLTPGNETNNIFLSNSGCLFKGFTIHNQRINNLETPTSGFFVSFKNETKMINPIIIEDICQKSFFDTPSMYQSLDKQNRNPLVGNGGGLVYSDVNILDKKSSCFDIIVNSCQNMSPNGLSLYSNGGKIISNNLIDSYTNTNSYANNGAEIILNNTISNYGDYVFKSSGFRLSPFVEYSENVFSASVNYANTLTLNKESIINDVWDYFVSQTYDNIFSEIEVKENINLLADFVISCVRSADINIIRTFINSLYFNNEMIFGQSSTYEHDAYVDGISYTKTIIKSFASTQNDEDMIDELFDNMIINFMNSPNFIERYSMIISNNHKLNFIGSGVNLNSHPYMYGGNGSKQNIKDCVIQENGGIVNYNCVDEENTIILPDFEMNSKNIKSTIINKTIKKLSRRISNSRTY